MEQLIIPSHISRTFIQSHKQWNFVYAADESLKGFFGQMNSAHGEPNSWPVPTLLKICQSSTDKFYYDGAFEFFQRIIDRRLQVIPRDKPIIVFPKIGTGYSQMNRFAPKLYTYLMVELERIKYPNIKIDYYA